MFYVFGCSYVFGCGFCLENFFVFDRSRPSLISPVTLTYFHVPNFVLILIHVTYIIQQKHSPNHFRLEHVMNLVRIVPRMQVFLVKRHKQTTSTGSLKIVAPMSDRPMHLDLPTLLRRVLVLLSLCCCCCCFRRRPSSLLCCFRRQSCCKRRRRRDERKMKTS